MLTCCYQIPRSWHRRTGLSGHYYHSRFIMVGRCGTWKDKSELAEFRWYRQYAALPFEPKSSLPFSPRHHLPMAYCVLSNGGYWLYVTLALCRSRYTKKDSGRCGLPYSIIMLRCLVFVLNWNNFMELFNSSRDKTILTLAYWHTPVYNTVQDTYCHTYCPTVTPAVVPVPGKKQGYWPRVDFLLGKGCVVQNSRYFKLNASTFHISLWFSDLSRFFLMVGFWVS